MWENNLDKRAYSHKNKGAQTNVEEHPWQKVLFPQKERLPSHKIKLKQALGEKPWQKVLSPQKKEKAQTNAGE